MPIPHTKLTYSHAQKKVKTFNSQPSTLNSQLTLPPYRKSSTKWLYKAPTPQKLPAPLPLYKSSQAKHWRASTPSKWLMLSSISAV